MAYAVYNMAPTGLNGSMEAQDVAAWACCEEHAKRMRCPEAIQSIGENNDALPETQCEYCGKEIA